jgi:hypothetical protein
MTWIAYGCPPGGPRRELGKHPTQELARAFVGVYVAMTGYRGELEGPWARYERWGPQGLELQRGGLERFRIREREGPVLERQGPRR